MTELEVKILSVCPPKPADFKPVPRNIAPPSPPMPLNEYAKLNRLTNEQIQRIQGWLLSKDAEPRFCTGYIKQWKKYQQEKDYYKSKVIAWQHTQWLMLFLDQMKQRLEARAAKNKTSIDQEFKVEYENGYKP